MSAAGGMPARTVGLIAISAASHMLVFSALGLVPSPSEVLAMHEMTFEVIEPELQPPEPIEPPPPPPEPKPEKERARPAKREAEPEPPAEEPKPALPELADFTGETLVAADGSGSWSTVVGSGAPLKGPVGKIRHGQADPKATPEVVGPRLVALDSLARRPAPPPGLDAALQRNYPARARMQGVEGRVETRLRILPTGRIGRIQVLDESPRGFEFASACRNMLEQAAAFVAPLDRSGTPVSADITFTCTFEVNY